MSLVVLGFPEALNMAKTQELFPIEESYPINTNGYSRFNNHPIYLNEVTREKFVGAWRPPIIQQKETDVLFEITAAMAYRPDTISYEFYATPLLWWILAYVNDISNPLDRDNGFYPGRVIRIPDITTISALTF